MDGGIGNNLPVLISVGAVFSTIGIAAGIIINNYIQKLQKDAANRNADKIRSDAEREAEHLLRDARVSAKSETIKMREECEAELKERRKEQSNNEKRIAQREEVLDRRIEAADAKLKNVEKREKEIELLRERPNRTMAQFADITQIGASTLSRIVNSKSTKPLSKENIIRIYECRANPDDVHLLDFLARANGMFPKDFAERVKSNDRYAGKRNEIINRERMMKNALVAGVASCASIKQVINSPRLCNGCDQVPTLYPRKCGDFILDLNTESNLSAVKSWSFFIDADLLEETDEERMIQNAKREVRHIIGNISGLFLIDAWTPEVLKGTKYSFVFLDEMVFNEFKDALKEAKLHTEISVILLDKTTYSFISEAWLPGNYEQFTNISVFEVPAPSSDEYDENYYDDEEDGE